MKDADTKSARGTTITSSFRSHLNPYIPVGFTILVATVLGLAVCSSGHATPDSLSKSEFEANAVVGIPPDPPAGEQKSKQPSVGPAKETRSITDVRSGKIPMCILYAGRPGSDREKDFLTFLRNHFREVKTGDLPKFRAAQTKAVDVTIMDYPDYPGRGFKTPWVRFPRGYTHPTVTVGVTGARICSMHQLKPWFFSNCMTDAAQGEPRSHEVFRTPFTVTPKFEFWFTPRSYHGPSLGEKVPRKVKVWKVQDTGRAPGEGSRGVVSRSDGFEDSPDAEVLTPGFNMTKESGAVGVGRHGNVLQWGFSAPPSQMTEAGKAFFLNCIVYIRKFDGKPPLVRRRASHRIKAIRSAALLNDIKDPKSHARTFPAELLKKYKGDPDGLVKYYKDNLELTYHDKLFRVDSELKSLGLESNRRLDTLERLIHLLSDEKHAVAAKRLLRRYTQQFFENPDQWRQWLEANRGRIYFSDVGGYKFRVVPKGYLEPIPATESKTSTNTDKN